MKGTRIAIDKAVKLAKETGVAYVGVKNSCHFGAGTFYVAEMAKQGMFGMIMSNVDPNMAVPGGKGMTLGNNPIAYAFPRKGQHPITFDIALSVVAALKINKAKMYHQEIRQLDGRSRRYSNYKSSVLSGRWSFTSNGRT